ncbi:MAG: helix-turn-helix domain-containing protein [Armatimonadota bacterium]|nr:helix-turn-helix domain-containing protein [bacterium]MDW8320538.1 helix-turn-helix domain-containing protein [Armatimonadota bacterium]
MRTLEDWFKYLEQQYVDEKAQKGPKSPQATTSQTQQPAQSEPATSSTITSSARQQQEGVREARSAHALPPLEQAKVIEVSVPDPADYIFTLRRTASTTPASPTEPTAVVEELKQEKNQRAEPEAEQQATQAVAPRAEQQQKPAVQELAAMVSEHLSEEMSSSETVAEPMDRVTRAKPVKRAPYTRSVRPVPPPQTIEELWKRVPKHVRLLVEFGDDEVTQKYYDRQFKESRRELVERLLNPSLTLEDTARLLGVCPTTVRRYTERGLLNHYRTPGNQRRFRLSDVIAFLEARQQAQEARRRKR